ncbi:hypothetical protein GOV10_05470 [Candidatus Woesearchaeota archaeon]|nr:hypothetical protein [Candidatus Woesearchaeota archaeon]
MEWAVAEELSKAAKELGAKEILSLEGVNVMSPSESTVFGYGNPKFKALGAEEMKESIIMGVSAALLLNAKNVSCIFAQAQSDLPDSKAAADIINFLDKYLKLGVDSAPLLKQAEQFEDKLKNLMSQTTDAQGEADKKTLSYLG